MTIEDGLSSLILAQLLSTLGKDSGSTVRRHSHGQSATASPGWAENWAYWRRPPAFSSAGLRGLRAFDVGPLFVAVKTGVSMLRIPISDLSVQTHWRSACPASLADDDGCNRLSRQSTRL